MRAWVLGAATLALAVEPALLSARAFLVPAQCRVARPFTPACAFGRGSALAMAQATEGKDPEADGAEKPEAASEVDSEAQSDSASEGSAKPEKDKVDDILNSPMFLKRKLEVLEKEEAELMVELEEKRSASTPESDEWTEKIERLTKEFQTVRDRAVAAMGEANNDAKVEIFKDVLGVTDNFSRAKGAVTADSDAAKEVMKRYDEVYDAIQDVFTDLGMVSIETVGQPFDPSLMEAVMMQPSEEFEEGVVMQEFQAGFQVGEKMVRPAFVVVSAG